MLLVSGGHDITDDFRLDDPVWLHQECPKEHKSSELYNQTANEWSSGPDLPKELYSHCMVTIDETTVLVIGGGKHGSRETTFINISDRTLMVVLVYLM